MRVYVYVDGFNLYYRALKGTQYKWLNLQKLSEELLRPQVQLESIRYFTARVSSRAGDPDAPRRQQILFSALSTLPSLRLHYGKFLSKTKRRPVVGSNPRQFVEIHDTEEKGSDVNLAVHLVNDGWHGRYDLALLLSQDTDLIEPVRIVTSELGLKVGLVWLDGGQPNAELKNVASFVRHVRKSHLARSQFPDPLVASNGRTIRKPKGW